MQKCCFLCQETSHSFTQKNMIFWNNFIWMHYDWLICSYKAAACKMLSFACEKLATIELLPQSWDYMYVCLTLYSLYQIKLCRSHVWITNFITHFITDFWYIEVSYKVNDKVGNESQLPIHDSSIRYGAIDKPSFFKPSLTHFQNQSNQALITHKYVWFLDVHDCACNFFDHME